MQTIRTSPDRLSLPPILTACLPTRLISAVASCGAASVEELRLHSNRFATVTSCGKSYGTGIALDAKEMNDILKHMCGGSLYAFGHTINQGYLTLSDGIRVGVCGSAAVENGRVIGINQVSGLMIRIPHSITVSAAPILERFHADEHTHGLLVYAPPRVGKTTLLRTIAAALSAPDCALRTVVVDTREELCYNLDARESNLDILVGYPRAVGIEIAVRTMSADVIVCDEIGNMADAHAILSAANCGVPLIASAHAASVEELLERPFMQALHRARVFGSYVGLKRGSDNTFVYHFTDRKNIRPDPPRQMTAWQS